ncbi:hypothetical protein OG230_03835 [Streptomyces sp. NBC_00234]|uniref:hypothetical protein n=1 Tax=Streptomyces sp. NBC_00234 TaxID=2903638 RepID=UPI002E2CAC0B|nr:hypothetical protein [Streptomyces sp. NBC_00234]
MLITAGAGVSLLTACTLPTSNTEPGPGAAEAAAICPSPSPAADIPDIPSGFKADELGVVTAVSKQPDFTSVVISTRASFRDAVIRMHKLVDEAGFTVLSAEDDGIDVEVFVKTPHGQGIISMAEAPCGQVMTNAELPEPPK